MLKVGRYQRQKIQSSHLKNTTKTMHTNHSPKVIFNSSTYTVCAVLHELRYSKTKGRQIWIKAPICATISKIYLQFFE